MSDERLLLPLSETVEPVGQTEMAEQVKKCCQHSIAVYPLGGKTALHYGLPATMQGIGLSTTSLNQIVDFPVRDLTITVEAGLRMQTLAESLAAEGLMLPLDVPQAAEATVGAVIATNTNGPRRFGMGTVRDYVIGIRAINGKGQIFNGGGRVVKNVAGYDFCKLLTGSMGTLGVITQATVKVKPIPDKVITVVAAIPTTNEAESAIASMLVSAAVPVAVEWLAGVFWENIIDLQVNGTGIFVVQLAGTETELAWSQSQVLRELKTAGLLSERILNEQQHDQLWSAMCEFPAMDSELVLQVKTVSSGVSAVIGKCKEFDSTCVIQADAGDGVVTIAFEELPDAGISRTLIAQLSPIAAHYHGHVETLRNRSGAEVTAESTWGRLSGPQTLHDRLKQQFDPQGILNPGRFVFK